MMRIAENILTGGDIGNNEPAKYDTEIFEKQYDPTVGQFYRVKGYYAYTSGSGYSTPISAGTTISVGILAKGDQPHTVETYLQNGTISKPVLERYSIEITTDWKWIFKSGVVSNELQDGDIMRLYVYPRDFELHWAKAAVYIGAPSDIWTPAHADLTPEQITTLPPHGEYKEIKSF